MGDRGKRTRRSRNRAGVSLVELVVAITLLGVVLASVAGLSVESAQRAESLSGQSRRQAAVAEEINRLTALPFTQLTTGTNCQNYTDPGFQHTRCVTVTFINTMNRRIQVIVTPNQPGLRPDTVIFVRANPPTLNPLNIP
ncbi:MAG: prepilin-type N-terminal cleavage/methylation domain-containing protein [Gemmatimonadota bacterium]|jgi:prepilin-type N-terminal cleavage/methylation domain-containing protein